MSRSKVAVTLLRFAKTREKHLRFGGALSLAKAEACSKVSRVANFFLHKSPEVQLRAVQQVESELMIILPDERSRFQNLRQQILDLIQECHA